MIYHLLVVSGKVQKFCASHASASKLSNKRCLTLKQCFIYSVMFQVWLINHFKIIKLVVGKVLSTCTSRWNNPLFLFVISWDNLSCILIQCSELCFCGCLQLLGSDTQLLKAIWFAQYYLLSSLPAYYADLPPPYQEPFYGLSRTGLGKGKLGKDYQGHIMCDNEYYLLPAVLPFHPNLAKDMLRYRSVLIDWLTHRLTDVHVCVNIIAFIELLEPSFYC